MPRPQEHRASIEPAARRLTGTFGNNNNSGTSKLFVCVNKSVGLSAAQGTFAQMSSHSDRLIAAQCAFVKSHGNWRRNLKVAAVCEVDTRSVAVIYDVALAGSHLLSPPINMPINKIARYLLVAVVSHSRAAFLFH